MSKTGFLPLNRSNGGVPDSGFLCIRISGDLVKNTEHRFHPPPPQNSETPALLSPSPGMRLAM